jgi:transposase
MINFQTELSVSNYSGLYDLIIPKNHLLRRISEEIDFSSIEDELIGKYCLDDGRKAIPPMRLIKYLVLKEMYTLSDVDLVERSMCDMAFKFFLGYAPEDKVIEPSTLSKFRKLRLKDTSIPDQLVKLSVGYAIKRNLIKTGTIIVDSTHTKSQYNLKSQREILIDGCKNLRKAVYHIDESYKDKMPAKVSSGLYEDQIEYAKKLTGLIRTDDRLIENPTVKEALNYAEEVITDNLEHIAFSNDLDARVGHKTADTSFFGYKTHLALTPERIITAYSVTSGEKPDGKELEGLITMTESAGIKVDAAIGDAAYSERDNLEMAKNRKIRLVSKLSESVTHSPNKNSPNFTFNKDAGMYVCKAGHMGVKKTITGKKKREITGSAAVRSYFFDVEKCKACPYREGCYKEGSRTKSFSVTLMSSIHSEQKAYQETEEFKNLAKERYKIEAKNSELKHGHGYDVASGRGLVGMQLQGAFTIFAANMKRIFVLLGE